MNPRRLGWMLPFSVEGVTAGSFRASLTTQTSLTSFLGHTMKWQLQKAKARFSEVVKQARADGPQEITVHGVTAAYLLSREDFEGVEAKLVHWVDWLGRSPLADLDLDVERDMTLSRDVRF